MVRAHKNAPMEVSSKKPVSVLREVIPVQKKKAIDPRFDRAFGHFNKDLFGKTFSFIGDIQKEERHLLKESIKTELVPSRREAMKRTLTRFDSMQKSKVQKEQYQKLVRDHRKMEAQLVEQGKNPYYLKRADLKNLKLAQEFEKVKERLGNAADLEKFIEKKRKRKASKQKRFIPNTHDHE